MKHIGKMKNNGAKIVVAYRTLPGDAKSALVVGTQVLMDSHHDSLMNLVQDSSAQQANELADILAVRKFPDGNNMLSWLHSNGHLRKVSTDMVIMTPTAQTSIQLDELNRIIAEQKGVSIEDLAVSDELASKSDSKAKIKPAAEYVEIAEDPAEKAQELRKQAHDLLAQADLLDPPPVAAKSKVKKVTA
jgi:hypothetical protein